MAFPATKEPAPPDREHLSRVLGWATEAIAEGEAFLKSQKGFDKVQVSIDRVMGDYHADTIPAGLSDIVDNRLGKVALDLAASLTDIKPFWEYRTFNHAFDQQADMLGKLSSSWWTGRAIDMRFCDVIKYSEVAGSGYSHLLYNEQITDLDMVAEDPRDVLPIRPSSNISVQDCFGLLIRRERTVNYVKARYPKVASLIRPDRDASFTSRITAQADQLLAKLNMSSGFMENLWASLGGRPKATMSVPSCDVFQCYVRDPSVNESGRRVWVGEGSPDGNHPNWSYWVDPGDPLYPRLRTLVFTRTAILRDGPSIYWHGLIPCPKLTLDPWPWSWMGKPLLLDLLPLQQELNRLLRGTSDHNQKAFRPDLITDRNSMSRAAVQNIDTRRAGLKLRVTGVGGNQAQMPATPPLDRSVPETIKFLIDEMETLSGVRDLSQMMRLGQLPSAETVEKMLESMTPTVRLRSRVMEAYLREFALITASNFFQFYDTARRVAALGPDGLTFEDFDYDPGTMIPQFVNAKDEAAYKSGPGGVIRPRGERAREFLRQFTYHIAPGSLLASSEVTQKLLYLQLMRGGVVDIWTALDKLGIPNVGAPPNGANTITERLMAQNAIGLGPGGGPAGASQAGRKDTAQTMPHEKGGKVVESK